MSRRQTHPFTKCSGCGERFWLRSKVALHPRCRKTLDRHVRHDAGKRSPLARVPHLPGRRRTAGTDPDLPLEER